MDLFVVTSIVIISLILCSLVLLFLGITLLAGAKKERTHQNQILIHLSLAEILLLASAMIHWVFVLLGEKDGSLTLKIISLFIFCTRWPSYCFLFLLTLDRLIGTKYALNYRMVLTQRRIRCCLAFAWSSWMFFLIWLIFAKPGTIFNVSYKFLFPAFDGIYLCFAAYAYRYIFRVLCKRRKNLNKHSLRTRKTYESEWRVVRMSLMIVCMFAIFVVLPDAALATFILSQRPVEKSLAAAAFIMLTLYCLSIPLTYIFMQQKIRNRLQQQIQRACCVRRFSVAPS